MGFKHSILTVRVQVLIAERAVDHITDGVDLIFRIGQLRDSGLVGRKLLSYRHQLLASRDYLKKFPPIRHPQDLLRHRLLSFARWKPRDRWIFEHVDGSQKETLFFDPYLSMNDYAGLAPAIVAGAGVGELPPVVLPDLSRKDLLVEVMPKWRFRTFDLWLLHLSNKNLSQAVRGISGVRRQEYAATLYQSSPLSSVSLRVFLVTCNHLRLGVRGLAINPPFVLEHEFNETMEKNLARAF